MIMEMDLEGSKCEGGGEVSPGCSGYSSMVHSKKVIKHALRQQAKRRRKNTTIAAGNSRTLPRIVVKPLPPPPPDDPPHEIGNIQRPLANEEPAATMREVLASLPGFSLKSGRRRSTKRLSAAAQLEAGLVDLESPASILANTSLRALLNRHTFQGLPPLYQRKLAQLLPAVDRQDAATSGLNNEFFARACLEWRKRLAEGEFTPENQQRLKMEAERDKNKLDPWKLKHFEPIWGEKREPKLISGPHCTTEPRSAGAVTRSSLRLRLESGQEQTPTDSNSDSTALEGKRDGESHVPKSHRLTPDQRAPAQTVQPDSAQRCEEEEAALHVDRDKQVLGNEKLKSPNLIVKLDSHPEPDPPLEGISSSSLSLSSTSSSSSACSSSTIVADNNSTQPSDLILDELPPQVVATAAIAVSDATIESTEELIVGISHEVVSPLLEKHNSKRCKEETASTTENFDAPMPASITDEHPASNNQPEAEKSEATATAVGEPQIPEEMEIDSETLRRIHELEVRGEMREVYEEISGCPENIYPILESMEISSSAVVVENQNSGEPEQRPVNSDSCEITTGNEEDAFIDANNYVLESREIRSEMLECSWSVDPTINNVVVPSTHEELQVPWPLVAAALDGSVAANITVTTQDECNDSTTSTEVESVGLQQSDKGIKTDANKTISCLQVPVDQGNSYESDTLTLQSIRFVQTNFHTGQTGAQTTANPTAVSLKIQNQQCNASPQHGIVSSHEECIVQVSSGNIVGQPNAAGSSLPHSRVQTHAPVSVCVPSQHQGRGQTPIVLQQQQQRQQASPSIGAQPRQIVSATVHQQYPSPLTVATRAARSTGQGGQRGSRSGNKEQGGGRSRSSTKEPPGAVNLERSYQICQAVIQSSPNRDQLKAHLKPPPSLLARADGAFTTAKPGGRSLTGVKSQKTQQVVQHIKQTPNKGQAVMLRHVFATTRQAIPSEVTENGGVCQITQNGANGLGQYILVQRTGVGDGAPRASSAPPLPPQIASMGVGLHLVRGRPASAGEGSHQAVTLKARGASDVRGGGGAEPGAPGVIMGGDPPPPCECNMRGAMVICRQCGAFCHDDCIGPQRICATCLIR
ncbi:polycomb protein Asx isoform X2 [Athalia rosae]|uniref:polycomb protein Asx isoform X2 n=1 Tax=Athalia rosae TaxID=37344 RepID=UPI0020349F5B|nr:polycomb protein Asx isoform X2 [Athalia rosae]